MRLSDEILSAYIDGELPVEEAAGVALTLMQDPGAARRLDELRKGDAALCEAFDWNRPGEADLTAAIAARMQRAELSRARARRVALLAVSAFAAAALGFAVGKLATPHDLHRSPVQGVSASDSSKPAAIG